MKFILLPLTAGFFILSAAAQPVAKTKHLFIITIDGFRWQEVFTGADPLPYLPAASPSPDRRDNGQCGQNALMIAFGQWAPDPFLVE